MSVPTEIAKGHVLEAMDRLGVDPSAWPRNLSSRDYDVIDPRTGARFPPTVGAATINRRLRTLASQNAKYAGGWQCHWRCLRLSAMDGRHGASG
jgi:hypothetical protein